MVHITPLKDHIKKTDFDNVFAEVLAWRAMHLAVRVDEVTQEAVESLLIFKEDN